MQVHLEAFTYSAVMPVPTLEPKPEGCVISPGAVCVKVAALVGSAHPALYYLVLSVNATCTPEIQAEALEITL